MLLKEAGALTVVAISSLALGIGANTTIFSIINAACIATAAVQKIPTA